MEKRNICRIQRVWSDIPIILFERFLEPFRYMRSSVVMLENHFAVSCRLIWPFFLKCSAQLHQLLLSVFPSDDWIGAAHNTLHPSYPIKYRAP
ncbi:hypothetical protein AVEN_109119-1 [Araneus ventricosus]|uniref:Uncharacterized protein n=1 Tax=Araneus ventricosus TaxID=182803 RepID=A0A4Y2QB35_ARAVE|nr:hypothetical protein AVEN_109119-1 [Araneus ventricosus]